MSDSQANVSPHCLRRAAMDCDVIWAQDSETDKFKLSRNIPSFILNIMIKPPNYVVILK